MRIGIVDYAGHPFQVQLSRKLAERGHDVLHLYFVQAITPRGMLMPTAEDPKTLDIEGVRLDGEYRKHSYVRRWCQEQLLAKGVRSQITASAPRSSSSLTPPSTSPARSSVDACVPGCRSSCGSRTSTAWRWRRSSGRSSASSVPQSPAITIGSKPKSSR